MTADPVSAAQLRQRAFRLVLQSRRMDSVQQQAWLDEQLSRDPELCDEVKLLLEIDRREFAVLDQPMASVPDPVADQRIDSRVGRFLIQGKIAAGGMGVVYRALPDWEGAQPVALKLIKRGMESQAILQRFVRERAILAGLKHSNIAQLLDAGVSEDGQPWFAMELVDGLPIHRYCDQHRLSLHARVVLMQQVITAVAAAHQQLVVHRDIKANNVLVTADGTVKLLDFGIAKLLDDTDHNAVDTVPGERALTIHSAAPEQLRGENVGTPTDVFQLGLLLFQLLLGTTSQRGADGSAESLSAGLRRAQNERPESLGKLAADRALRVEQWQRELRGDLDRIVAKAIHLDSARRYATALAFGEDLQRWLDNLPVVATPDSLRYRLGKLLRRHRQAAISTAVVVTLILFASGWAIERSIQAQRETRRAQAAEQDARASEARAQLNRKAAEATRQLFVDALVLVDPLSGLGPNPTRQEMFKFAAQQAEERLKSDPAALVDVLSTVAASDVTLDDRDAASDLFKRILVLTQDQPELSAYRGIALARLGYFANMRGDADAMAQIDAGIDLLRRSSPSKLSEALRIKISILFNRGQMDGLAELAREATEMAARGDGAESMGYVSALTQQAIVLSRIDSRRSEALPMAQRAAQVAERNAGREDQMGVIVARGNLAEILSADGRGSEALPIIKKNVVLGSQLLGATHTNALYMIYQEAGVESDLGLFGDAAIHYKQAMGEHPEELSPIASAAMSAGLAGALVALDRYAEAAAPLKTALNMCKLRGDGNESCVRVRFLVARAAYAGQRDKAQTEQVSALRKLVDNPPPLVPLALALFAEHPRDISELKRLGQLIDTIDPHSCATVAYARFRAAQSAYTLNADAFADDQLARAKNLLDECWDGHPPLRRRIDVCVADRAACRDGPRKGASQRRG